LMGGFGLPLPRASPVPSSRFCTAWTVFSVADPAGLLHPAADPGVHRVAAFPDFLAVFSSEPSTVRHPSKRFPRQQPPPLWRLLPSGRSPSKDGSTSGRWSAGESVASQTRCRVWKPDAPLGFTLPSRVHPSWILRGAMTSRPGLPLGSGSLSLSWRARSTWETHEALSSENRLSTPWSATPKRVRVPVSRASTALGGVRCDRGDGGRWPGLSLPRGGV